MSEGLYCCFEFHENENVVQFEDLNKNLDHIWLLFWDNFVTTLLENKITLERVTLIFFRMCSLFS